MDPAGWTLFPFKCCLCVLFWDFVCSQKPLKYNVAEEQPVGTVIGNIMVDAGLQKKYRPPTLNKLRFTFLENIGAHRTYLALEERSGIIRTSRRIDRERLCPRKKRCVIQADIAVRPTQYLQVLKVVVDVSDTNDNSPIFKQQSVSLTVSEGRGTGILSTLPKPVDDDVGENAIQGYKLHPNTNYFRLSTAGGNLRLVLARQLDRETNSQHVLSVIAFDGGIPAKSGTLSITITVSDINDNLPAFENETYKTSILENTTLHASILQIRAKDSDTGENGQVSYMFSQETKTEYGAMFSIDKHSGIIYVAGKLKFQSGSYDLSVIAKDNGLDSLSAETKVTIRVVDVNDHAPAITVNALSDDDKVQVSENSPIGTFVAHLSITDQDAEQNGEFGCTLDNRSFKLQKLYVSQYKILTETVLDRETRNSHLLKVTCVDHGRPRLSSYMLLTVSVADVNDNAPIFSQNTYFAKIKEDCRIGSPVASVNATDKDSGANAIITYKIARQSQDMLAIDPKRGRITTTKKFDREKVQDMEAVILAEDSGKPHFVSTATLLLTVIDVNDERPAFSVPSYGFYMMEVQPVGTKVGRVYAADADSQPYNMFTFSIEYNNEWSSAFTIDSQSGIIRTTKVLHRNNGTIFNFVVIATEVEAPWLSSKANVSVYLVDQVIKPNVALSLGLPTRNLLVILGLAGALALLLFILVLVIVFLYKRRRNRHMPDRRGYISGNLVRVTRADADVIRTKGALLDVTEQATWRALHDVTQTMNRSKEKCDFYPVPLHTPSGNDSLTYQKSVNQCNSGNTKQSTPGDTPISFRADRRRASDISRAGEGRRKAADGASETRVGHSRAHCTRSSQHRSIQDVHKAHHSLRRHGTVKDSDSACSADVSNSDSGNCASDDPESHRKRGRRQNSTLKSREGGPPKSRGNQKRHETRRIKAESFSSPDSEIVGYQLETGSQHNRDECQPGPSGANRIALVHPQRNGENDGMDEQGERISLSDSCQGDNAVASGTEEAPATAEAAAAAAADNTRDHDFLLDSDTGSSGRRPACRSRPEGQSQSRPPKQGHGSQSQSGKSSPYYGSCVNDTDFYESDSESRGRNIVV